MVNTRDGIMVLLGIGGLVLVLAWPFHTLVLAVIALFGYLWWDARTIAQAQPSADVPAIRVPRRPPVPLAPPVRLPRRPPGSAPYPIPD